MTEEEASEREAARDELLDYVFALEFSIAMSALETNPAESVAGLILAMRKEFAPTARVDFAPIEAIVGDVDTKRIRPRKAKPAIASDGETDGATGHCECGWCGKPIDPWDKFCRHCGVGVEG